MNADARLDAAAQLARAARGTRELLEVLYVAARHFEKFRDDALLDGLEDPTDLADAAEEWTRRVERARALFPSLPSPDDYDDHSRN